jgi:phosphate transport system substrate-binding protein
MRMFRSRVALMGLLLAGAALPAAAAATVTLAESGSSLLYPLVQFWIADYANVAPGVTVSAATTNSGEGLDSAIAGKVRMGGSDAYMSDQEAEHNRQMMDIPLVISAQAIAVNLPDMAGKTLKLDGPTLAGIYGGRITTWDAAPIAAMNPGLSLPHQAIVPVRRAEASGDTFIFTQFLDFTNQGWEDAIGYSTTVAWPSVPGERTATGNDGMVKTVAATPYSIGYVGVSFLDQMHTAGLVTVSLKNQDGNFLLPTPETVSAGASNLDRRTPADERLSLVFAPGPQSYPLVNYEYVVVSKQQPDAATADALRHFLDWSLSLEGGNSAAHLNKVGFVALPDFIRALSEAQVAQIR